MRLHRLLRLAGTAALIASAVVVSPVAARTAVDPGSLNPAPPDFFNAACFAGAGGTLCTLHFADDPIVDEPSGLVCGSTELLFSQERSVVGKRLYDGGGNLVQRHFREFIDGTFTNPDTGRSLAWTQHDTIIHDLAVPGVLDSGSIQLTGLITRAWLPGGGSVLLDAGTILEDFATGELIHSGGPHPLRDYFANADASAIGAICSALD